MGFGCFSRLVAAGRGAPGDASKSFKDQSAANTEAGSPGRLATRPPQYFRNRLTSLPWMRTRSGPKMRVS